MFQVGLTRNTTGRIPPPTSSSPFHRSFAMSSSCYIYYTRKHICTCFSKKILALLSSRCTYLSCFIYHDYTCFFINVNSKMGNYRLFRVFYRWIYGPKLLFMTVYNSKLGTQVLSMHRQLLTFLVEIRLAVRKFFFLNHSANSLQIDVPRLTG